MKQHFALYIFMLIGSCTLAQETKVYFGLGGMYSIFQDTRFSDVQFNKTSVIPELGFSLVTDKNYWHAYSNIYTYNYTFPGTDTITYFQFGYNIRLGYLRKIKSSLFIGANWDIIDYYKRQTEFLANGADAYKLSSDFYISGKYLWDFTDDWQINFGLDIGIFSFINTEPSFSANYQQNLIDNGEVTFIDEDTRRPYNLKNMGFKPMWEQFNLRTMVELNYKRRLSLYYSWDLRTTTDNKDYPVIDTRHILTLRFNFINHKKNNK